MSGSCGAGSGGEGEEGLTCGTGGPEEPAAGAGVVGERAREGAEESEVSSRERDSKSTRAVKLTQDYHVCTCMYATHTLHAYMLNEKEGRKEGRNQQDHWSTNDVCILYTIYLALIL